MSRNQNDGKIPNCKITALVVVEYVCPQCGFTGAITFQDGYDGESNFCRCGMEIRMNVNWQYFVEAD